MKNVVLTGIGGQGTVLAAKVLAQAAQARGWHVRTAETIGMAQRGGSVVSHVRMGDKGEQVAAPLVSQAQADMLIAFEPGEGVRMRHILKPQGVMVTASHVVQPVTASLSEQSYEAKPLLDALSTLADSTTVVDSNVSAGNTVLDQNKSASGLSLYIVNETPILNEIHNTKALNIVLLTVAIQAGVLGITVPELKEAIKVCVKPQYCEMNLAAVDVVCALMN